MASDYDREPAGTLAANIHDSDGPVKHIS